MKLYLVRHGIAVDRLDGEIKTDFDRPLTPEGITECEQVAKALRKFGLKPDLLVSSPLVRAKQTAEVFAKELEYKNEIKIADALKPAGSPADLYKFLGKTKANEIMFFGHEPDMGELACNLLQGGSDFHMPFKKSGVCRIDVSHLPPSGSGVLKWFITPKIAKAIVR